MSKFFIIAAAVPALLFAAPAFAQAGPAPVAAPAPAPQTARHPAFNGPHGSASDLTDRPPSDPTAVRGQYREFLGRDPQSSATNGHVKVFSGKVGAEVRSAQQSPAEDAKPGRRPGFEGPHGSASNLRDTPSSDPTAAQLKRAKLFGRKAGDDKRQDYGKPAQPANGGLTKAGPGTLTLGSGATSAARAQSQNNLKQMSTANAPR